MKFKNTLEVFGKTENDLMEIAKAHSYNNFIFKATIKKMRSAKRGFMSWNELVDFFLSEGHTIRQEFSNNPEKFVRGKLWG